MTLKLNTELFLIPDGNDYLVYAPLRFSVMKVSAQHANLLTRLKRGRPRKHDRSSDLVKALLKAGVVNGTPESKPPTCVGQTYMPTSVTLLLTNRCNLACTYCYAGGQTQDLVMPVSLGRAAIAYIAANCKRRNQEVMEIGFHGGGEPTMAWEELTGLTQYAQKVAKKEGLKLRSGVATNGCLTTEKAEWIAHNLSYVNISLDGPPRLHDRQRPMRNGRPSSNRIRQTLRILEAADTPYGLQATMTKDSVHEMPAIVRYFARYTKPNVVKFEPVCACGRYRGQRNRIPLDKLFARFFNEAYEVGKRLGLDVSFSAIRGFDRPISVFCGAFAEPFVITPDGYVSACYEAFSADAPYAKTFFLGHFDRESQRFHVDKKKLERLRKRNIYTLQRCKHCFCKYTCAGDCATRTFRHHGQVDLALAGARCEAIREITRYRLENLVDTVIEQVTGKENVNAEEK